MDGGKVFVKRICDIVSAVNKTEKFLRLFLDMINRGAIPPE